MRIPSLIEALLFVSGEPLSKRKLAELIGKPPGDIDDALRELEENLKERGIRLLSHENNVSLASSPEASELVAGFIKEEIEGNLSKPALETLTIVLYYGPVARATIDYIRGVNSTFTLHTLLMRGLVERIQNPKDARSFLYKISIDFMKYLGITSLGELAQFDEFRKKNIEPPEEA